MKTKSMTLALIAVLIAMPIDLNADEQPPQEDWALAACIIAGVGMAVTGIYLVANKCKPRYYWLMDSDQPPKFWVGTATRKQCAIEGWTRIGGPYDRPQDAPAVHPPSTNRVESLVGPAVTLKVQATQDLANWTTVYQETCDTEDFGYCPTNQGFFRLEMGQ